MGKNCCNTSVGFFSNTHNNTTRPCPFRKSLHQNQKVLNKENLYSLISDHRSNSFAKIFIMQGITS